MATLDRRITIKIAQEGSRDNTGVYVPGPTTDYPVWATRRDRSLEDIESEGGTRNFARRDYRVRWFSALASTSASLVSVLDSGDTLDCENLAEVEDTRRRYIDLQAQGEIFSTSDGSGNGNGGGNGDGNGNGGSMTSRLALGATQQSGIRRYAFTQNKVSVASFYSGGHPLRLRATFTGGGGINSPINGPRSVWSNDTNLDTAEINDSGGPVNGDSTGRLFDAPTTRPSEAMLFFGVYWIDRESDGSPEPDEIASIRFV